MKNDKSKNIIIGLLLIIIIILGALVILFATDTLSFNTSINKNELSNKNIKEDKNTLNDNIIDDNNKNQEENNNIKMDESNFIRETKITLVDEPNCTGNNSPLIANIESNGNISISQNRGAIEIKVGNAKYLYRVGILACDNFKLYYITEDNELYVIDNPNSTTLNQKATKITESKIIEFLGVESKNDGGYLKVLVENGEIEYIKNFNTPN